MMKSNLIIWIMVTVFSCYSYTQKIIQEGGKYGLIDENGSIVLQPKFDTITKPLFDAPFFILENEGKYGFVLKDAMVDKGVGWTINEVQFNNIKVLSPKTTNCLALHQYLVLELNGDRSILCLGVTYEPTTGIFTNCTKNGVYRLGSIEHKYDSIYRRWNNNQNRPDLVVVKNGKSGLHVGGSSMLEPIYDSPPDYVDDTFLYAWKSGRMGLINTRGEVLLPYEFDDGNLPFLGDGRFIVAKKNENLRVYDATENEQYPILIDGETITQYDSMLYSFSYYRPSMSLSKRSIDYLKIVGNRKYGEQDIYHQSRELNHIVLVDTTNWSAKVEYKSTTSLYDVYESFVIEYERLSDKKMHVTIYRLDTKEIIKEFNVRRFEYPVGKLKSVGGGHKTRYLLKFKNQDKNNFLNRGWIHRSTLKITKLRH